MVFLYLIALCWSITQTLFQLIHLNVYKFKKKYLCSVMLVKCWPWNSWWLWKNKPENQPITIENTVWTHKNTKKFTWRFLEERLCLLFDYHNLWSNKYARYVVSTSLETTFEVQRSLRIMFPQDLVTFVHQQVATIDKQSHLIQQMQDEAGVSLTWCLIKLILEDTV